MEALTNIDPIKINIDQEKKKKVASTFALLNKNYKELNWTQDSKKVGILQYNFALKVLSDWK